MGTYSQNTHSDKIKAARIKALPNTTINQDLRPSYRNVFSAEWVRRRRFFDLDVTRAGASVGSFYRMGAQPVSTLSPTRFKSLVLNPVEKTTISRAFLPNL